MMPRRLSRSRFSSWAAAGQPKADAASSVRKRRTAILLISVGRWEDAFRTGNQVVTSCRSRGVHLDAGLTSSSSTANINSEMSDSDAFWLVLAGSSDANSGVDD